MRGFIRVIAGVLAGLVCLAGTTGVALAGGYGAVSGEGTGSGGSRGVLPFTGVDLVAYALVAVAIVAAGIGLRSLARRGSGT